MSPPESGLQGSEFIIPDGYRLVWPRVRFHWARFAHLAARSSSIKITLCGRVSPGKPVKPGETPEICSRCRARAR